MKEANTDDKMRSSKCKKKSSAVSLTRTQRLKRAVLTKEKTKFALESKL